MYFSGTKLKYNHLHRFNSDYFSGTLGKTGPLVKDFITVQGRLNQQ